MARRQCCNLTLGGSMGILIGDLLAGMTLEEKMAQLNCVEARDIVDDNNRFSPEKAVMHMKSGIGHVAGIDYALFVMPEEAAVIANSLQYWLQENTRLRIPAILHEECLAGLASRGSAAYPHPLGLASMWEPDLIEKMAERIRKHVRSVGAHQALSPVLDLCADPRWGRCEETYGDDAYLVAMNAAAFVKGLQGADLKKGVAATAKHFVAHGHSEGGRNCAPVHMGPRELRDTVMVPFEMVVKKCGLKSVMNAYHDIDGIPCAASGELLTNILRDEWGFDGVVVSDYFSVERLREHHFIAESKGEAGQLAMEAGLDVELPSRDCFGDELLQRIRDGKMEVKTLDRAVERVLRLKNELGLFDRTHVDPAEAVRTFAMPENRDLARELARKSIILLKNEGGILPLDRHALKRIAIIGPNADSKRNLLGDYSYVSMNAYFGGMTPENEIGVEAVMQRKLSTVLEGIKEKVLPDTEIRYAKGCDIWSTSMNDFDEAIHAAEGADVAVVVIGDRGGMFVDGVTSGEHVDRMDITPFGVQSQLVETIVKTRTPVILVLMNGRPLAVKDLCLGIPAVLEVWFPGEEGGHAIADILFGDFNPGGKLPVTLLDRLGQYPASHNIKPVSGKSYIDGSVLPLFPFGHGLSFTSFTYEKLDISPECIQSDTEINIRIRIQNTGTCYGDEIVQLYIRDEIASVVRPKMELKGFARIGLKAGEKKMVTFRLHLDQLAFHRSDLKLVVEPGTFKVMIGSSSRDIRQEGVFRYEGNLYFPGFDRQFMSDVFVDDGNI